MTRMKWLFNLGHKIVCQSINSYCKFDVGAKRVIGRRKRGQYWIEGYTCVHYNRLEIIPHCSLNYCSNSVAVAAIARRLTSIYYGCNVGIVVQCSVSRAFAKLEPGRRYFHYDSNEWPIVFMDRSQYSMRFRSWNMSSVVSTKTEELCHSLQALRANVHIARIHAGNSISICAEQWCICFAV